jgi:cytochrome c-type biogenesis protein CcmF
MLYTFIGNLGHLFVISAFIFSILTVVAYFIASVYQKQSLALETKQWKYFGRLAYLCHSIGVIGVVFTLFYIIYAHRYEYHYAWSHSSNHLPIYYMVSCFWEGQEGSFLLWIFWHVVLGWVLIATNKFWESSVMTIFAAVQTFLVSMILGVVVWNLKIGSDPFILLRDAMPHLPIFQMNPDFVPQDGSGLNPLLQNYWMVIHPPTLFLGFALTIVPFSYCIAGLWQKRYTDWVRPALPWSLFGGAVLGLGILMGGYWAYETLNFGGYWNWDPVENAVYVPWLVLVATIHTMIAYRSKGSGLIASMVLSISSFLLILYATFLTRSGILGDASVHSFTDLGLSGQLLLYLITFLVLSLTLFFIRFFQGGIPASQKEITAYSGDFWLFIGVTVLCLSAFQVLFETSKPVYNKVIEALWGWNPKWTTADPIPFYTQMQMWGGILVALFSATTQFFWWKNLQKQKFTEVVTVPLSITLLVSTLWIAIAGIYHWEFIILLTVSVYALVVNATIMIEVLRKSSFKLTGGSIAHIGIALMLLGIMFSAGYSKIVSKNNSGLLLFDPKENPNIKNNENEDNVLLWRNQSTTMTGFDITYKGEFMEGVGISNYLPKSSLYILKEEHKAIVLEDIRYQNKVQFRRGDTIQIYPENTYYQVEYKDKKGNTFSLYPRAQINEDMGGLLASPDIYRQWSRDLYTHVSSIPVPDEEKEWTETEQFEVSLKDTFFVNDYVAILEGVSRIMEDRLFKLGSKDAGVKAHIKILGKTKTYEMNPAFIIKDNMAARIPDNSPELGLKITLLNINPETNIYTFGVNTAQKDYIIMKAMEKPLINLLWIGTFLLMIGFGIATYRRYTEFVKMRDKGMEVKIQQKEVKEVGV